jgi:hypothetical protein
MACFVPDLAIAWALVCFGALQATSVALRVVFLMATTTTAETVMAKTFTEMLQGVIHDAAHQQVIAGLALALSSFVLHFISWHGPEGLIVFCVEAERGLCLNPWLKVGIESEVILTRLDC